MFSKSLSKGITIEDSVAYKDKNKTLAFWLLTIFFFNAFEFFFSSFMVYSGFIPSYHTISRFYLASKIVVPTLLLSVWILRTHIQSKDGTRFVMFCVRLASFGFVALFLWRVFSFIIFLLL